MVQRSFTALRTGITLAAVWLLASCADPVPLASPDSASDHADLRQGAWSLLSAPGTGPSGIKAVAHAPGLRAIFVASVLDNQPGQLWRFDLRRDQWARMRADNWPIGKYRKLIHDPVRRRLVTYWDGIGQVYSIPDTGGAWTPDGSATNSEEYYEAYAFFDPVASRLTVFGGYGYGTFKNLLWQWDGSGQWLQMSQNGVLPAPRFGSANWVAVDRLRQRAFIMHHIADTNYDDLWRLDLATRTWTQLIPGSFDAETRMGAALAYDEASATLYRFGGASWFEPSFTNDLLVAKPDQGTVAWSLVPTGGAAPSARSSSALIYDQDKRRLVMVSGSNGGDPSQWIDDVWAFRLR